MYAVVIDGNSVMIVLLLRDVDYGQTDHRAAEPTHWPHMCIHVHTTRANRGTSIFKRIEPHARTSYGKREVYYT